MKNSLQRIISCSLVLAAFNLAAVTGRAEERSADRPQIAPPARTAPSIVSTGTPLSAGDLAKYQQKATTSLPAAENKAAGADNRTVWIIVGVAVLVGAIALAAGGGGGGGGY